MADRLPELVLVAETDAAAARRTRRLAVQGTLRRSYPSIYTSNVDSPAETIVLRHWQAIVGHLLPDGVISHRSAFDSRPHEGSLSITRSKTRRDLRLPGLTVHIVPGPGPRLGPPAPDSRFGALYLASDPRRFLENLTRGRGWNDRVLPQEDVEAVDLLDLSPLPPRERVVEVRVEAPSDVDDIVVRYADGHRDWVQVIVGIRRSDFKLVRKEDSNKPTKHLY